jgi:hypothetical protein
LTAPQEHPPSDLLLPQQEITRGHEIALPQDTAISHDDRFSSLAIVFVSTTEALANHGRQKHELVVTLMANRER